jgi:hypothetical protein
MKVSEHELPPNGRRLMLMVEVEVEVEMKVS